MKNKKTTQREVADRLGLSEWNLSRYLSGKSRPKLEEAERLVVAAPETSIMMWLRPEVRALRKALGLN